jgi:hypothetical protein
MCGELVHIGEKINFPFVFPTNSTGASFHLTQRVPFLQLSIFGPEFVGMLFVLRRTVPQQFIFLQYKSENS